MSVAIRPLVTVVVPVYNVERYVDACLESVRGQTYPHLEILVVEDCSSDGSLQTLEKHLDDTRVRLLRHRKNSGLSAARNTGIEAATGDYVMFVDSDDVVDTGLVAACVEAASSMAADVVLYGFIPFPDGDPLPAIPKNAAASRKIAAILGAEYFRLPHFAWLKFLRAALLREHALRFPVGYYYEDWPFHWELGLQARIIVRMDEAFYLYRQRGSSITGSSGKELLDVFRVQRIVLDAVHRNGDAAARKVLAEKVGLGRWSVLSRIDDCLLPEAIRSARQQQLNMRRAGMPFGSGARSWIISMLLGLPGGLAMAGIRGLRALVTLASSGGRYMQRRRRGAPGA